MTVVLPTALKLVRIRRLQQLQADRGAKGPGELGKIIGRKTNQTSDLLNGRTAFGERVARSIEANAGLPLGWLDQDLEATDGQAREGLSSERIAIAPLQLHSSGAEHPAREHRTMLDGSLPLSRLWVAGFWPGQDLRHLRYLEAPDDLMEPTFNAGDLLLIDIGCRAFAVDAVYVLRAGDSLYARRVRRRMDGMFEVSADSSTVKTSETVTIEQLEIAGRVLYAWRGKKL